MESRKPQQVKEKNEDDPGGQMLLQTKGPPRSTKKDTISMKDEAKNTLRVCNASICAIDIIQMVFQFNTKKEAAKKLSKYRSSKKNGGVRSLSTQIFINSPSRTLHLVAASSWCDLLVILRSCRNKHKVVNFIDRNSVFLRSVLGNPPLACQTLPREDLEFGASSLGLLKTCRALILDDGIANEAVSLLPLKCTLYLDDLIDDLGQAFNQCYNIERSSYSTKTCHSIRYIRLACQARGVPSSKRSKSRSRDSIKCSCQSVCTLKGKVDTESGRILVCELPLLFFKHTHSCTSIHSGGCRPLHPSLEMFILEHKCMTLQMGDLHRLCSNQGVVIAEEAKEKVCLGRDARFKPTITQIRNVLKRDALRTWRRGNDQSNLRAQGIRMSGHDNTYVVFRESRERQHAIHAKLQYFHPGHHTPQDVWVYNSTGTDSTPHVSTEFLHDRTPVAESHKKGRQRFLFLWMTKHGKYMLERYGCWAGLDSTYRLNMYGFPLTILVVKSNVGNAFPVCFYLSDLEDTSTHAEAIALVKWMCPRWLPETILSDCAMELVNAVESNFPKSYCIWCLFHVEQALLRHTKRKSTKIGSEDERKPILALLRALMYAKTRCAFNNMELDFLQRVRHCGLQATEIYYLQYLKQHEIRWAAYARNEKSCWGHVTSINTNNLNESFNGKLKQHFGLKKNKLVTTLVMKLQSVSDKFWTDYVDANTLQRCPYRTVYVEGNLLPSASLCTVPRPDIVLRALSINERKARQSRYVISPTPCTNGLSWSLTGTRFQKYTVTQMGNTWSCTCVSAARARIPCQHVFAILQYDNIDFRNVDLTAPHFVIDDWCFQIPGYVVPEDKGVQPWLIPSAPKLVQNREERDVAPIAETECNYPCEDQPIPEVIDQLRALRNNLFQTKQIDRASVMLYKRVLEAVEEYATSSDASSSKSSNHVHAKLLAQNKRLYDYCVEHATYGQFSELNRCVPLIAALREITQVSVPMLRSPCASKKRDRDYTSSISQLPMEKFVKTCQLEQVENQKKKVVRTLSQSLHDKNCHHETTQEKLPTTTNKDLSNDQSL